MGIFHYKNFSGVTKKTEPTPVFDVTEVLLKQINNYR